MCVFVQYPYRSTTRDENAPVRVRISWSTCGVWPKVSHVLYNLWKNGVVLAGRIAQVLLSQLLIAHHVIIDRRHAEFDEHSLL